MTLEEILHLAVKKKASDIHLKAGIIPVIRRHGKLRPLDSNAPLLQEEEIKNMLYSILTEKQKIELEENFQIDLGHGISGLGRFRISAFYQRGSVRVVIRAIPFQVPTLSSLGLPSILKNIAKNERGLVLVTGVTGSGKSSTLAALINYINQTRSRHILTLEDPIEFLIRDNKSLITQRELGVDIRDFAQALRSALRQDPDIILIGEMRDQETIETALLAAETGHLVFSTLHTIDAQETINRLVATFSHQQQQQVRHQLASVLKAVVSQRLARRADKKGFVPVVEILVNNARIREMIKEPHRTHEITQAIEESRDSFGMQSFDQNLMALLRSETITYDMALKLATNPEDFAIRFSGITSSDSTTQQGRPDEENWDNLEAVELDFPTDNDGDEEAS